VVSAVRAARLALNWSQANLASTSGVSEVSIARLESGALSPRLSTLSKLQSALDAAGVTITLNQPTGGYTLALTAAAVATSRRRYDGNAPKAGHEQDGSTAQAGQQQDT
jgi:transcriptional regulator with XRE-family HTH domain